MSSLDVAVRRGLAWSTVSNLVLRVGSLALGIVLARVLEPSAFGAYAVALTVQSVLMTLADLGLSADLIRSEDPGRMAKTVASLALGSGAALCGLMMLAAGPVTELLGSPASAAPVRVLSLTLVVAGFGVVPYAMLQRGFEQRKLFVVSVVDFTIGATVTLVLLRAGYGVMAIAIGRLIAQSAAVALQFRLARVFPRIGFDRSESFAVLRFGVPVGAANLLSWALLSIDTVVIARQLGSVQLGYYVLAFNISSWPMSALGQVVRSVALPGFARQSPPSSAKGTGLPRATSLVWALALPAGVLLAIVGSSLVSLVYGARWSDAAVALGPLALFGALRVIFDLFASFLLARGAARATLVVQVVWFVSLVPAVIIGAAYHGLFGAAWAHVIVAVLVVTPMYLFALSRVGVAPSSLAIGSLVPVLAMVPAGGFAWWVTVSVDAPLPSLLLAGSSGVAIYAALVFRWVSRQSTSPPAPVNDAGSSMLVASVSTPKTGDQHDNR